MFDPQNFDSQMFITLLVDSQMFDLYVDFDFDVPLPTWF